MGKKTALYETHVAANAHIVDFSGWDMPLHYGSQIEEHHQVRQHAGIFDVSHMLAIDIQGMDTTLFLRKLLANDIAKLSNNGRAMYSCLLNPEGGIIDDLITYKINENSYRIIVNCGNRESDYNWIASQAKDCNLTITTRQDLAILAIQGPKARTLTKEALNLPESVLSLKPFQFTQINDYLVARTGYTGEDGFEIMLPVSLAASTWKKLINPHCRPIGLAARDTLRLEAGLNLYGQDMDAQTHPFESNLGWTVCFKDKTRDFIGKKALTKIQAQGNYQQFVGLILKERGVLRHGQNVITTNEKSGVITSGTFSPTLKQAIAFARIPHDNGDTCQVMIRNKSLPANIVKPVFVRHGKIIHAKD